MNEHHLTDTQIVRLKRRKIPSLALTVGSAGATPGILVIDWILNDPNTFNLQVPSSVIGALGVLLGTLIAYFTPGGRHGESQ